MVVLISDSLEGMVCLFTSQLPWYQLTQRQPVILCIRPVE